MSNPEKKDVGGLAAPSPPPAPTAPEPPPASDDAAKATKEVNRTIQLDLAQVDLLDVPLPPSSSPKVDRASGAHEANASKGPPPLPPSLPPEPAAATAAAATPPPPQAGVSARKLLEGGQQEPPRGNPALRFALGLGFATIICVALWFGLKALRKPAPATSQPIATASAPASAAASAAPIRTITIAPIEMTGPALGASEDKPAASAAPSSKPAVSAPPATTNRPPAAGTGKPRAGDDLIKVEN